jgi:hypothetical protein
MFINRITFSIEKNKFKEKDWIAFNRIASYLENLLHHNLPRNVTLGGFGFLSNKLQTTSNSETIKPYGQCIDYVHRVDKNEVANLLQSPFEQQLDVLNRYLKKSVLDISKKYAVDTEIFLAVI